MCGRIFNENDQSAIKKYDTGKLDTNWSVAEDTVEDGNTDAYGTMRFVDAGNTEAQVFLFHFLFFEG